MYEIKSSIIHGLGVFASQDIKKGTKICDYYGLEMSWKEFREKYGAYKDNSLNTYPLRRIWRIIVAKDEPYKTENVVNYINESLNANVILKKRALYSKTNIINGEELLLTYPKDYQRNYSLNS
jgi:SET domain-containing protein